MEITFEQLPSAVSGLYAKLENIERLLQLRPEPSESTDKWFNLDDVCAYIPERPAKATVYGLVHNSSIPFHKRGKKLYFLKSEIDTWLKSSRKKTTSEMASEADAYLSNSKKKIS